jgi:hypothetical protein
LLTLTDEITTLVHRLIESDDIGEIRQIRQELSQVIREHIGVLRKNALDLRRRQRDLEFATVAPREKLRKP